MECVSTISYSIMVNGALHKCSKPIRGIRQGDLLSPYLLIMCAEALSCLLLHANNTGYVSSFPMERDSLSVRNLFFVNDSLIFCKVNSIEWSRMLSLIETYEQAFGQFLNREKSSIFFSSNMPTEVKNTIIRNARTSAHGILEKQLGLPNCLGQNKTKHFHFLLDKTWFRMPYWKTKLLLSVAGRDILLKAMLQAIPTNTMSIFLFLKAITYKFNGLYIKFQCGYFDDSTKIQWIDQEKIGLSKALGGFGVRNVQDFNLALLTKQCQRLFKEPSSYVNRVFKQKYHRHSYFLLAKLSYCLSFAQKSLMVERSLLKDSLI